MARADGRLVAVGEWGHVLLSDDGGGSWRQAESVPTRVTLTAVTFTDAKRGWAVGHDAVVIHTRDGGETWELQHQAPEEEMPLLSVWFEDAEHGLAAGAFAMLLETRDGGETWRRRPLTSNTDEDYHLNAIFRGPGDTLFIAAEYGSIYRSLDDGASWERLHPPYDGSFWGGLTSTRRRSWCSACAATSSAARTWERAGRSWTAAPISLSSPRSSERMEPSSWSGSAVRS